MIQGACRRLAPSEPIISKFSCLKIVNSHKLCVGIPLFGGERGSLIGENQPFVLKSFFGGPFDVITYYNI